MKKGFTLVEMLIVIGIIVILMGATLGAYSASTRRAARTHAVELVSNVSVALNEMFIRNGRWPARLVNGAKSNRGQLTADVALALAKSSKLSISYEMDKNKVPVKLTGVDRCGIVTPWAAKVVKRLPLGTDGLSKKVPPSGREVKKHILYYAIDTDGDGITEANVGGETIKVRANAVVWCIGAEGGDDHGEPWPHSQRSRHDDVYSWSAKQVED